MPIQADAATGVMTSYNLVNGRPVTVSPDVGERVRGWTDETLLNVTDAFNPNNLVGSQDYYDTLAEADAATLKAGVDSFTTDNTDGGPTVQAVRSALEQGLLTEADVDEAVRHALTHPGPPRRVRPRRRPVRRHRRRRHRHRRAPSAGPRGRRRGDGAAGERRHPAAGLRRRPHGRRGRPARRHAVHRLVLRRAALRGDPGRRRARAPRRRRHGPGQRGRGPDRAARGRHRQVRHRRDRPGGCRPRRRTAPTPAADAQFDVFEWGEGVVTLRNAANDKYVGYHWGPFRNDQAQPNGWFVQQQFKLEEQPDGTYPPAGRRRCPLERGWARLPRPQSRVRASAAPSARLSCC